AAAECQRLGLEMTMHGSGGWSESGGPWVKPEDSMQKYVFTEQQTAGPRHFSGPLARPGDEAGRFQGLGGKSGARHYQDSAVIAYRTPANDAGAFAAAAPRVTASGGAKDLQLAVDGSMAKTVKLADGGQKTAVWLQLEFAQPYTARGITMSMRQPVGFDLLA